ncbi:helix-turn-helix transcriptional regulator [Halorarius litoreus]|uniref:helix-turn-helix transcriptional regulator n=1 Tax=Halorarius litoreus TaxID=2962676 RepID=UPI0020CE2272|nr:MarR family transcriptional regulator [Halorarius litoreus]
MGGPAFLALPAVSVGVGLLLAGVTLIVAVAARRFGWASKPSTGAASTDSGVDSDTDSSVAPPSSVTGLDDEEAFVVDLLHSTGGRLQQSAIVEASDWSKSKVSRLLSRMERDGLVEKVSVGRENVVLLTLDDP